MKLLIKYIDFHWDNYQGGSGKSFEFETSFDIPEDLKAIDIFEYVHKKVREKAEKDRPFLQKYIPAPIIIKVEIV